jgi:hypothetical protein
VVKCSDRRAGTSQERRLPLVGFNLIVQLYNEILHLNQLLFYVSFIVQCQCDTLLKCCNPFFESSELA